MGVVEVEKSFFRGASLPPPALAADPRAENALGRLRTDSLRDTSDMGNFALQVRGERLRRWNPENEGNEGLFWIFGCGEEPASR